MVLLSACGGGTDRHSARLRVATVDSLPLRQFENGVVMRNGGFGSAIAVDPRRADHYYLLTDRGPNLDAIGSNASNAKVFPLPQYTPQIGHFAHRGDALRLLAAVELKDESATPLTGLPFSMRSAGVSERAVSLDGTVLEGDPAGIDSEGLVVLRDDTFWVSDEYGPTLLHLDATGRTLERVTPFEPNARGRRLPRVLALRRPNHGMEGLTVTRDERTLVGIMQGPLENPPGSSQSASRLSRLVTFDLVTGATRQFLYVLEELGLLISAITAVTDQAFLVLERDEGFAGDRLNPARIKGVYRVELAGATDVSDPADGIGGRLVNGRPIEQLQPGELAGAGIVPVRKSPFIDLLEIEGGYPHDKPEGLTLVDELTVAVSNDDDFGIVGDSRGGLRQKILPGLPGTSDHNRVYFIRLDRPLRVPAP